MQESEKVDYWLAKQKDDLARRCAILHKERNEAAKKEASKLVETARKTVSDFFVSGRGIEIGAGGRPFPLPKNAACQYGDIKDADALKKLFNASSVVVNRRIDAQTFVGVQEESLDFVISAHVIEFLEDPIGSIESALRVLHSGGVYVLAVSDMRYTFDKHRQPTPIAHLVADYRDGGKGTRVAAYVEHLRDVSGKFYKRVTPENQLQGKARALSAKGHEIHFHAWTADSFAQMLREMPISIDFTIAGRTFVANENIFVLRRT